MNEQNRTDTICFSLTAPRRDHYLLCQDRQQLGPRQRDLRIHHGCRWIQSQGPLHLLLRQGRRLQVEDPSPPQQHHARTHRHCPAHFRKRRYVIPIVCLRPSQKCPLETHSVTTNRTPCFYPVRSLFYLWNDALATGDSRIVAARYAPDAVLLPTVSDTPRTNPEAIKDYFDAFLQKKVRKGWWLWLWMGVKRMNNIN